MDSTPHLISIFKHDASTEVLDNLGNTHKGELEEEELSPRRPPSMTTHSSKENTQRDPFERLYRLGTIDHNLLREKGELEKLQNELSKCTFQPQINARSWKTSSKVFECPHPTHSKPPQETYSFNPQVKGVHREMTKAHEYIKNDPFDRLYRQHFLSEEESHFDPEEEYKRMERPSSALTSPSATFFQRQQQFEQRKKEKIALLQATHAQGPVINDKSRQMVTSNFLERNQEFLRRKTENQREAQLKLENSCSFQPEITLKAKMVPNRSCMDRSYRDSVQLQVKHSLLREQEEQTQMNRKSLVPINNHYNRVAGKLNILSDPESYVQRIKEQQRNRERLLQIEQSRKLLKETEECTHIPAITAYTARLAIPQKPRTPLPLKPDWR